MGMIRKTLSISTFGIIDFWSDKERIARYTKQTRNATRRQMRQDRVLSKGQTVTLQASMTPMPGGTPPGWYPVGPLLYHWDGEAWTGEHRP